MYPTEKCYFCGSLLKSVRYTVQTKDCSSDSCHFHFSYRVWGETIFQFKIGDYWFDIVDNKFSIMGKDINIVLPGLIVINQDNYLDVVERAKRLQTLV